MLPKWKKDAKEFTVSINHHETRGYQSSIPKPIIKELGDPDKITFEIHGKHIQVVRAKQTKTTIVNNNTEYDTVDGDKEES